MAKLDIEDIRRKVNSLAAYINVRTRTEKVKLALLEEYKRGRFHDIPARYLEEDPEFVDELERLFIYSDSKSQRLPLGLLNRDVAATRRVLISIIMKLEKGIEVDTIGVFERKDATIFDDANLAETLKYILINYKIPSYDGKYYPSELNKITLTGSPDNGGNLRYIANIADSYDRGFVLENKNVKINFLRALLETRMGFRSKIPPIFTLPSNYPWLANEDYLERKLCDTLKDRYQDEFSRIELEHFGFVDDELNEFLNSVGPNFRDDAAIRADKNSKENLKLQKDFLLSIVQSLDKIGALDELTQQENDNIKYLNSLIINGDRIKKISKEDIYETIDSLDLDKPEDAIKMLIINRQLTNKLAHNYVAFIYTGLYMNSIGDNSFAWKRSFNIDQANIRVEKEVDSEFKKIEELFDKAKKQYKLIYEQKLAENTKKRDEEVAKLRMEGKNEEADALSKKKVKATVSDFSFADDFKRAYKKYDSDIGKIKRMIIQDNPNTTENIRENIRQIKEKEARKNLIKDDKLQYCVDIYDELDDIMKKYNELNKNANNVVKRESFHDLVTRILRRRDGKNEYSHLELTVGGEPYNVGKRLEELIDRVVSDGIIKKPFKVLSCITKRMELIQQLYSCKHLFTKALVNAAEKYPDLLKAENNPVCEKLNSEGDVVGYESGIVDIYYKGALQVFGGHYKAYEPEASDEKIQSLPPVDFEVNEAFKIINPKTKDSYLATYIPFFHVTDKQVEEIKKSLLVIEDFENNTHNSRSGLNLNTRRMRLKQNKNLNPLQFDFARKRAKMLTDESRFSKEKSSVTLDKATCQEMEMEQTLARIQISVAEIIIAELLKGTSIEDLKKVFSQETIDYAKKNLHTHSYVLEGIEQTKPGENIDQNCVAAAIRNGHFSMAMDYKNANQEAIRFNNHMPKEIVDEEKQED